MDGGDRRDRLQEFLDWAVASGIDPERLPDYRRFGEEIFVRSYGRHVTETHILAVNDAHESHGEAAQRMIEEVGDAVLRFQEYQRSPDKIVAPPPPPTREMVPRPSTPAPITPAPITPAPITPAPITPAPITPAPTPAPITPAPITPASAAPLSAVPALSDAPVDSPPVWTPRKPSYAPSTLHPTHSEDPPTPTPTPTPTPEPAPRTPEPAPRTPSPAPAQPTDPEPPPQVRPRDPAVRKTSIKVLVALVTLGLLLFLVPRFLGGGTGPHPPGSHSVAGKHLSKHLGVSIVFPKGWRHLTPSDVTIPNVTTATIYGDDPLGFDPKSLGIFNLSGMRLSTYYRGRAPPKHDAALILGFARASGPPHWKTNVGTTDSLVNYGATLLAKALPSAGMFHAPRCENANLSTTAGRCVIALDPGYMITWFAAMRDGYAFAILHSPGKLSDALTEGDALVGSLLNQ